MRIRKSIQPHKTTVGFPWMIAVGLLPLVVFLIGIGMQLSAKTKASGLQLKATAHVTIQKNSRGCDSGTTKYYIQYTWKKLNGELVSITSSDYSPAKIGKQQSLSSVVVFPEASYFVQYDLYQVTRGRGKLRLNNTPIKSGAVRYNPKTMKGEIATSVNAVCQ